MNKKAQVLIVGLWILVILTLLAIGIGHRVSMALRISRYQRDKLKALYLAKAGINRAIRELENDANITNYDALNENWADDELDGETIFEKINFDGNENEFATVNYATLDENNETRIIYGVIDEERKININTASKDLLVTLFTSINITNPEEIVNNTLIWRGNLTDGNDIYNTTLGYACKGGNFTNPAELKLVKDISGDDYEKIRGLITVYGGNKINVNTAPEEVLTILANSTANDTQKTCCVEAVVNGIITTREQNPFYNETDILIGDVVNGTGDDEALFANLKGDLAVKSDNFLIAATGNVGKIKSKITAVYNRLSNETLYWHEN